MGKAKYSQTEKQSTILTKTTDMDSLPICIREQGWEDNDGLWHNSEYLNHPAFSYSDADHFKTYNFARGEVVVDCYRNGVTTVYYSPTGVVVVYRRGNRDVAFGDARYKASRLFSIH